MPHPTRLAAKNRMNAVTRVVTRVMTSDLGLGRGAKIRATATGVRRHLVDIMVPGSHLSGHCGGVGGVGGGDHRRRRTTLQPPEGVISFNLGSGMADVDVCQWASCPADIQSTHAASRRAPQWGGNQVSVMRAVDCLGKGGEETEGQSLRKT